MHIIKDISKTIQDRDLILVSFDSPDHSTHFRALICQNWTIFRKFAFFQGFAHLLRAQRISSWPIFSNFFLVTQDTIRDHLVKKLACYKFCPRFSAFWSISPIIKFALLSDRRAIAIPISCTTESRFTVSPIIYLPGG